MSGRGRGNSGRGSSGRGVSSRGTSSRGSSGGLLGGSSRSSRVGSRGNSGGLLGGSSRGNSGGLLGGSSRGNSGGLLGGNSRNNSGMSLGRVAKKAAVATAVNRVVGNTINNRMGNTNSRGFNNTLGNQMQQSSSTPVRDIKEIRDRTGASLHDAKRAYERNYNNIDLAIAELTGHPPQQETTNICPNCNNGNPQHAQFCLSCGGAMADANQQQQPIGQQQQPVQPEQQRLSTCPGCKASLAGVTENVCPYCRSAIG